MVDLNILNSDGEVLVENPSVQNASPDKEDMSQINANHSPMNF